MSRFKRGGEWLMVRPAWEEILFAIVDVWLCLVVLRALVSFVQPRLENGTLLRRELFVNMDLSTKFLRTCSSVLLSRYLFC